MYKLRFQISPQTFCNVLFPDSNTGHALSTDTLDYEPFSHHDISESIHLLSLDTVSPRQHTFSYLREETHLRKAHEYHSIAETGNEDAVLSAVSL